MIVPPPPALDIISLSAAIIILTDGFTDGFTDGCTDEFTDGRNFDGRV